MQLVETDETESPKGLEHGVDLLFISALVLYSGSIVKKLIMSLPFAVVI